MFDRIPLFRLLIVSLAVTVRVSAAAGQSGCPLDPGFGAGGLVTNLDVHASHASLALQPDGKLVVGALPLDESAFVVARYNADGTLDTTFGAGTGTVSTTFGQTFATLSALLLQPDGKIVAAGNTSDDAGANAGIALARYNADGTLDPTFGLNGRVVTPSGVGVSAIAGQADGKIVLAGAVGSVTVVEHFALVRYNADGSVDTGFGLNGVVETFVGSSVSSIAGAAIQPDGRIVVAGDAASGPFGYEAMALARYNVDGTPDASFGTNGTVLAGGTAGEFQPTATALVLQPDGKIVAAGIDRAASPIGFLVARFNPDGTLDATFGAGGYATTPFAGYLDSTPDAVALQADGKIVAAGVAVRAGENNDVALARFEADGTPDASFGTNGQITTDIAGQPDVATALVIQPNGAIVIAGSTYDVNADAPVLALLRYGCAPSSPTSTTLTSSANPSTPGQTITFTATVTAASGSPTGSITFSDGAATLGIVPLIANHASLDVSTLAAGSHTITASYGGDATFAASTSAPLVQFVGETADMAVTIGAGIVRPRLGEPFTLVIDARNNGPDDATGARVRLTLSSNLTFVSATPSAEYDPIGGVWTIGAIASGATRELQLIVTMSGLTATATANVSADQADLLASNNTASLTLQPLGVIVVDETCSLRSAIIAANTDAAFGGCPAGAPGLDTIVLNGSAVIEYSDVYETPAGIGPNALPAIASPIAIEGQGAIVGRRFAVSSPAMRVFFVKIGGALTLHDVTVRNGIAIGPGGGILLEGAGASLVVDTSRIVGNHATGSIGGGIASDAGSAFGGDIVVRNSVFAGNVADTFGGAIASEGTLTITDTAFGPALVRGVSYAGNAAGPAGGAIQAGPQCQLTMSGGVVNGNQATDPAGIGGGIHVARAGTIANVTVSSNRAPFGGGIFNNGNVTLVGGAVTGNSAGIDGGGIYSYFAPQLAIQGSTIAGNTAVDGGGGLAIVAGPAVVTGAIIGGPTAADGNVAGTSGGGALVALDGSLTMTGGTVANNVSRGAWNTAGGGGGVSNGGGTSGGTVVLTNVLVAGNQTIGGDGAGIFNHGSLRIVNSTISGNVARALAGGGGSGAGIANGNTIFVGGPATLIGSTVSGNAADGFGGGIQTDGGGTLTLSGTAISNNSSRRYGGGLYVVDFGTASIGDDSVMADNTAAQAGGGVAVIAGTLTMSGGSILRNVANGSYADQAGGGGIVNGQLGSVTLTDVTVANNRTPGNGDGGGIFNFGVLNVTRGTIAGNAASASGGAIGNGTFDPATGGFNGGTVTLTDVTISANTSDNYGGAILNHKTLVVNGGTMTGNHAAFQGGAIMSRAGSVSLTGAVLDGNTSDVGGGNVYNEGGTLLVDGGAIRNGTAPVGGGIYAQSTMTVQNGAVVSGNLATGHGGGGVYFTGSSISMSVAIRNSTLGDNHADSGNGGGLLAEGLGQMTTSGVTIDHNVASYGGGIVVQSPIGGVIANTAITRNTALHNGGGLYVVEANVELVDDTISANTALRAGGIAALAAHAQINASTIVDNQGDGVMTFGSVGGSVELANSIVAGSRLYPDCSTELLPTGTPPVSRGYNLFVSGAGCPIGPTDKTLATPAALFATVIGPLTGNGGPTETHALLPGSPALDAGDPTPIGPFVTPFPHCPNLDQRGFVRPVDGSGAGIARCDIGAFEQQTALPGALTIASVTPAIASQGGPDFVLTIDGTGFTLDSVIEWNGSPRSTEIVSETQLRATIPASDLATAGDVAAAIVSVSRGDGAVSNAVALPIVSARVVRAQSRVVTPGTAGTVSTAPTTPIPVEGGVTATLTRSGVGTTPATVTVANYAGNPTPGTVFAAGGVFDIQVSGADASDSLAARLYYPSSVTGAAESALQLLFWNGTAWTPVIGSGGAAPAKDTTDNLDGTRTGGRFSVTFDSTSTPTILGLSGTVFALVTPQPAITGSGYNAPELPAYRASFSIDAAGIVKYSYTRTRMNFVSTSVDAYAVTESTVTIQGSGTINGVAGYSFTASATDGSPDTFAIEIRRADGSLYFQAPTLALAGGAFTTTP